MAQPFWDGAAGINDEAWNFVWLGGNLLPGVSVVDAPFSRSVEKKKAKGSDGTTVTDQGDELAPVTIRTEVYTPEQWEQWQEIIPTLWPKTAGSERTPLEIIHPLTAALGITAVYVEKLHMRPPENQVMVVEITAFDWATAVRPVVAAAGATGGTPPVAQVPQSPTLVTDAARNAGETVGGWLNNVGSMFTGNET